MPARRDETEQPLPAYIENRLVRTPGGRVAPFPHMRADAHTTAALVTAYRHARDLRARAAADIHAAHP
ncbi:hypothetical protein GPX89_34470 [Nocardia sp. ET3-3]|uniref:Uncharacterized protein n=1 Tax=Nocardia terrae TaxID=2675851 RepID=A0A7K1V717_9NOCA|nr:hypothetical protein [Nocardia terrae]MVU82327.1 hypothetical protein [Nocardia terrae]